MEKLSFWMYKMLKMISPLGRAFLFIFDTTKDVLLWVFLYSRLQAISDSGNSATLLIDGEFFSAMVQFNLFTILCAQCIMGLYVVFFARSMFSLPETMGKRILTRCLLFLCTPFLPCLVILKVTRIKQEKMQMINQWNSCSTRSPTEVSSAVLEKKEEIRKNLTTYAVIKLIEACIESLPQLVLLAGYFFISLTDSRLLSISDDLDSNSGSVFFAFNLFFSFITLVTSIVNAINVLKLEQLSLTQKMVLFFSYGFQIVSRILPILSVVIFTLNKQCTRKEALLLIFLPIFIQWLVQYLISYITAPAFKHMQFFDQILHVLTNTFVVIPLRHSSDRKQQTHRSREMFWSFALFVAQVVGLSAYCLGSVMDREYGGRNADEYASAAATAAAAAAADAFKTASAAATGLIVTSLVFLLLGPLTLVLYYRKCHTWRGLNDKDRQRSAFCPFWFGCGPLGNEIAEERDATEDISMDILDVCNNSSHSPVDDEKVTKVSKSMTNISMLEKSSDRIGYNTI